MTAACEALGRESGYCGCMLPIFIEVFNGRRYKDNLLAALSTPLNTNLQYRYTKDLIEIDIIKYPDKIINQNALVRFLNLKMKRKRKIIPVRKVSGKTFNIHGSSGL